DGVGDGTAGDRAEQRRGHHGNLGGTSGGAAGDGQREVDEKLSGAGFLQEGAEEDEQDDVGCQDAGHHAEYAVGGDEERDGETVEREAAVCEELRQVGAEQAEGQRTDADQRDRPAEYAAAHLERQQYANHANQLVELILGAGTIVERLELADPVHDRYHDGRHHDQVAGGRHLVETPLQPLIQRQQHGNEGQGDDQRGPQQAEILLPGLGEAVVLPGFTEVGQLVPQRER